MLLAVSAPTALWSGPGSDRRTATILVLLLYPCIVAATLGGTRYRLLFMPLLAIQAAMVFSQPRSLSATYRSPWRIAGVVATLGYLALS